MEKKKNKRLSFFSDISIWALLISNLITIYFTITQDWSIDLIIWTYLIQSIIIGIFNFIRILTLNKFSTVGFKVYSTQNINGKIKLKNEKITKEKTAFFFLLYYGSFNLAYAIFLIFLGLTKISYSIVPITILFLLNHLFSFYYNKKSDEGNILNIGQLVIKPFIRIIPMHLIIMLGVLVSKNIASLIIFMLLKTIADIISHIIEHTPPRKINPDQEREIIKLMKSRIK